jgi:hypothetical protein
VTLSHSSVLAVNGAIAQTATSKPNEQIGGTASNGARQCRC